MSKTSELQIIISSGPEDARASLGFAAGIAAAACGTRVVIFLALNGARWALRSVGNAPQQPGFQSVSQMLELLQSLGGRIEVCSNCLGEVCSNCLNEVCAIDSDGARPTEMRQGIHPGGLAAVAARMSEIPTVSF